MDGLNTGIVVFVFETIAGAERECVEKINTTVPDKKQSCVELVNPTYFSYRLFNISLLISHVYSKIFAEAPLRGLRND